jgi:hypothetical protein
MPGRPYAPSCYSDIWRDVKRDPLAPRRTDDTSRQGAEKIRKVSSRRLAPETGEALGPRRPGRGRSYPQGFGVGLVLI